MLTISCITARVAMRIIQIWLEISFVLSISTKVHFVCIKKVVWRRKVLINKPMCTLWNSQPIHGSSWVGKVNLLFMELSAFCFWFWVKDCLPCNLGPVT